MEVAGAHGTSHAQVAIWLADELSWAELGGSVHPATL